MTTYEFDKQLRKGASGERFLDALFRDRFDIKPGVQRQGYDRVFTNRETGERLKVEYKRDATAARTHNLFVETVSVDTEDVAGWAYTSGADVLMHYIPEPESLCYVVRFQRLRRELPRWCSQYPERSIPNRGRYGRSYHTVGVLVPQHEYEAIAEAVIDTSSGMGNES